MEVGGGPHDPLCVREDRPPLSIPPESRHHQGVYVLK